MKNRDEIVHELHASAQAGTLTTFRIPNAGDLALTIDHVMLGQALDGWKRMTEMQRSAAFGDVLQSVRRGAKRYKKGKLRDAEMDAFASDCTLWLAHEILFSNGEAHIVPSPEPNMFAKLST